MCRRDVELGGDNWLAGYSATVAVCSTDQGELGVGVA